jgi:hypothetical protein
MRAASSLGFRAEDLDVGDQAVSDRVDVPAVHIDLRTACLATAAHSVADDHVVAAVDERLGVSLVGLERLQPIAEELADAFVPAVEAAELDRAEEVALPDDVRVVEGEESINVVNFCRLPDPADDLGENDMAIWNRDHRAPGFPNWSAGTPSLWIIRVKCSWR